MATHKSYLKLLLSVTFGSVPLYNNIPNVQQKHISKVEARPAHLHLEDISIVRAHSTRSSLPRTGTMAAVAALTS